MFLIFSNHVTITQCVRMITLLHRSPTQPIHMGGTQTAIVSVLDVTEHPEFQTFQKSLPAVRAPMLAPPREINKVRQVGAVLWEGENISPRSFFYQVCICPARYCLIGLPFDQVSVQSPFTDFMATVGATSNLHMTMPDALKSKVRMPGVAGFGTYILPASSLCSMSCI
jgi:hypothetical protein